MANAFSLYDILGVERDVTEAQIRTAFRKLTLQHHPDRFSGEDRQKAEERFQDITEAFNEARLSTFTDPEIDGFVVAMEYSAVIDSKTTNFCSTNKGN